jgi:hypothetical protein
MARKRELIDTGTDKRDVSRGKLGIRTGGLLVHGPLNDRARRLS